MADSSTGSSRTRLVLFAIVGAVVVGWLLLWSGERGDPSVAPVQPTAERAMPQDAADLNQAATDRRDDKSATSDGTGNTPAESRDGAIADRETARDQEREQALAEARARILSEPDRQAVEEFRSRVAAGPPRTPDWLVDAIAAGPPPVPVDIEEQLALGPPEVPAEMLDAIEQALVDGPPPTPPELQRAIEEAQR